MKAEEARPVAGIECVAFLVIALASCATAPPVTNMPQITVGNYPQSEKFDLKVDLQLSEELRSAIWHIDTVGVIQLGMQLTHNAETVAGLLFADVAVTQGATAPPMESVDAILIPRLIYAEQISPPLTFSWSQRPVLLTVILEWTLKSRNGNLIWVDTVEGKSNTAYASVGDVIRVLDNLFRESFRSISSAQAIKEFATRKRTEQRERL